MSEDSVAPPAGTASSLKPPKAKKSNVVSWVVGGLIALALVLGLGYLLMTMSGPKLEAYSTPAYSMQVPKGYDVEESDFTTNFVKRDADGAVTSGVLVFYQTFPQAMTSEDVKEGQRRLKDQAESILLSTLNEKYTIENLKVEDATAADGSKVYNVTADLKKGETTAGVAIARFVMTDRQTYVVLVVSEKANAGMAKRADAILDSFDVK